ncbi:MAG: type II toxin-antitoxin system Phd/YefM family antitoxin [Chloroflexi bacterium]|nr:type II toxin-antitoxin system Phd/YefM family antitoxin [Chloroflexota bacterium]MDQ3400088.1 type II toxin-antitoxin system Phd/YefM family antitoxin [Chloroflexota bacterium]
MKTVNIHEAKTHLSRLIARAVEGEEIVIAKAGRPVAKLVGLTHPIRRRKLGLARGKIVIHDDFDAPLPEDIRRALGG